MDRSQYSGRRPAILWDMDGTLVDSEPLHCASLLSALERQGLVPPSGFHDDLVGRDAEEEHDWCRRRLGLALDLRAWLQQRYQAYFELIADLRPREGALDLLQELRLAGHAQAIVSNSDRLVVDRNLDAVGLLEPGLVTVSRNDVRQGKPDPEPYRRAAWLLQAAPEDCLVIEDSTTGAVAGLTAGMRVVFWPQTDLPTPKGAERIDHIEALATLIRDFSPT
jgi:HAD superfamily hydrolase (TIGR01509 family)